ncbi:MAG: fused MFS/spermidine synthase [Sphingomonadaceae bacterium]|nr:fused MFS/spermidine synthase [Sphingomonadaceae bacterium]
MNDAVVGLKVQDGALSPNALRWLFTATIFLGSFLLFMVQPMVARMALPRLGGAPAVWNSAMLVYQALLLAGYGWAHGIARLSQRTQWLAHGALLLFAALFLPIGLAALNAPTDYDIFFFVPKLLLISVGPILLVISAQAPLIQRWFAVSAPGANPYALYAASNLGSFGGLIAYPLLVEPSLPLLTQSHVWSMAYALLLALTVGCGWLAMRAAPATARTAEDAATSPAPTARTIALWIVLSAVPSGMMLSTTTHLTTDIMAMPLLWAIPLGLYLLSFSIAFGEGRFLKQILGLLAPPMLLLSGGISMLSSGSGGGPIAASSLFMLFTVAVALHSRLYAARPEPDRLTFFYLMMAVGGALGGLFCALIAPLMFDWVYEHPLLVLAAAMLVPLPPLIPWADWLRIPRAWHWTLILGLCLIAAGLGLYITQIWTAAATPFQEAVILALVIVGLLSIGWRLPFLVSLMALMIGIGGVATMKLSLSGDRTRSYFGIYTIREYPDVLQRTLSHGTTLHGTELTRPGLELTRTSYYGPDSGIGLTLDRAQSLYGAGARIAIVGLGTGTLSCYRQSGEQWTFYEIDPAMVHLARDSGRFGFMPRCGAGVPIIIGDARLKLAERAPASIDVLAVDAFSSDAIPIHLLTREAFDVYGRAVQPDGLVLVHISNRFVDLEPVLRALTVGGRWKAALRYDEPSDADRLLARTGSIWVAMSHSEAAIARLTAASANVPDGRGEWQSLSTTKPARLWTDDFASVLPLLLFSED